MTILIVYIQIDVPIPDYHKKYTDDASPTLTQDRPIPYTDVALVHPLPDPVANLTVRDVVIPLDKIKRHRPKLSDLSPEEVTALAEEGRRQPHSQRRIAGTEIIIPFPPKQKENQKDTDADTLRVAVEERTWMPTLLRPPMPESVIDELRNKYSRLRTRHEPEYVAAKEEQDRAKEAKKDRWREMMTPLQEWHENQRRIRYAPLEELRPREREQRIREKERLEETMARVGEFMAAKGAPLPPVAQLEGEGAEETDNMVLMPPSKKMSEQRA